MKVFILRHGEAERIANSDRERELTNRGREQVKRVVERNQDALAQIDLCFASPFVRTQQTAQVFSETLVKLCGKQLTIETDGRLTPDCRPKEVLEMLCSLSENSQVLLVSHQPLVSELTGELCELDPHSLSMPPATLATIHLDPVGVGFGQLLSLD